MKKIWDFFSPIFLKKKRKMKNSFVMKYLKGK